MSLIFVLIYSKTGNPGLWITCEAVTGEDSALARETHSMIKESSAPGVPR